MMRFFNDCKTLEELKKAYHAAVMEHHPDRGGDLETMQAVNNSYDTVFPKLKDIHANKEGKIYTKETDETPEHFKDIISKLMRFEGTYTEIIGSFIWVNGDTKPYKDQLKELDFKWHSKKTCWYLAPVGYRRFGRKQYDMDEIRNMYGSTRYDAEESLKLA